MAVIFGELQNAQIESVASLPTDAADGRIVKLTTDGFVYFADGTNWVKIDNNFWDTNKTYNNGDIVRDTGTYDLYGSITNNNTGNALSDGSNWVYLGSLAGIGSDLVVSLSGTPVDVDWSQGNVFKITIAADTTYTFSNITNKKIRIIVTDSANKDNVWPTYLVWDNGAAAHEQTHIKTDIYEFECVDGIVYAKREYVNLTGAWPYGILGDLIVGAGVTTDLAAGQVYDYDNITIAATGKLRFTGNTTDFTILGAKTNFTLAGTIECKGSTAVGVASTTTPDGVALSHTITQKAGGAGGAGGNGSNGTNTGTGAAGGAQSAGVGGYGGGGGGAEAHHLYAGNGSGMSGAYYYESNIYNYDGGDGHAGGAKGLHGKNLYIRCEGIFDGTAGTIDLSGSAGSNGVAGHTGACGISTYQGAGGGGGSGGGAGGSAGKLYIRHHTDPGDYTAATYIVTGGAAGSGGSGGGGVNTTAGSHTDGSAGSNGTAGDAGSTDVAVLV